MEKDAFYEQLNDAQGKLPKGDIVMVISDLNDNVVSDSNLLGHVLKKHGLGDHKSRIFQRNVRHDKREFAIALVIDVLLRNDFKSVYRIMKELAGSRKFFDDGC